MPSPSPALHPDAPADSAARSQNPPAPGLEPIEDPERWRVWIAYKLVERQTSVVITPLKVINARIPGSLRISYEMQKPERSLSLGPGPGY
jgi:hypothetical protein